MVTKNLAERAVTEKLHPRLVNVVFDDGLHYLWVGHSALVTLLKLLLDVAAASGLRGQRTLHPESRYPRVTTSMLKQTVKDS